MALRVCLFILLFLLSAISAVVVHELGHFIGSKIDRCDFKAFVLFGWALVKKPIVGGYVLKRDPKNVGQCIVRPRHSYSHAKATIIGGPIANLIFGSVSVVGLYFTLMRWLTFVPTAENDADGRWVWFGMFVCMAVASVLNIYLGIWNLIPEEGGSNDGATFVEVSKSGAHLQVYNNTLIIVCELVDGKSYAEIEPDLFKNSTRGNSSLFIDMLLYDYYRSLELINRDKKLSKTQKYEDCRMSIDYIKNRNKLLYGTENSSEIEVEERIIDALYCGSGRMYARTYAQKEYLSPREWLNDCALAAYSNDEIKRLLCCKASFAEYKCLYPGVWKSVSNIIKGVFER